MLKNYLKIAVRNIRKRKVHSLINVFGLAIALTAFTLIMLWVQDELRYDHFNIKADRIYRINTFIKQDSGNDIDMAMTSTPLAAALKQLPEVENVVRLQGPGKNAVVKFGEKIFNEDKFFFADQSLFNVFTFPFIEGNPNTALQNPYSIVLTESMAKKYFGNSTAIGKIISVDYYNEQHNYAVTGVMKDVPEESHIHINFFASLSTLESLYPKFNAFWNGVSLYTYVLLSKNASIKNFENKLPGIIKHYMGNEAADYWSLTAQKLTDIHLHSHRLLEIEPNGNASSIYIFGTAGFLILLIAIINFISLTTTKFADRAKEVGVRKVMGAGRKELIIQFIYENVLIVLTGFIIAISIIELALPYFNSLVHKMIEFSISRSILILAAGLLVTSIAASYPAFMFSSFSPIRVLNKRTILNPGRVSLRKILVILQFSIAMALIMCSFSINDQLHFILNKDLGINIKNTVLVPLRHPELREKYPVIKNEFLQINDVKDVSASSSNPADMNMINSLDFQGKLVLEIKNLAVDYDFIKTMGLQLLSGRNFSRQIPGDSAEAIIINKAAAEKLKAMHLIDKQFEFHLDNAIRTGIRIIGTVNNYNYRPLYYQIEPMIFYINPDEYRFMEVKISPDNISRTLSQLKQKWEQAVPNYPFDFTFLDQSLKKEYESDLMMGNIFDIFSLLAILIGCLGLFGLASYSIEKRTKEIGIRKVLGSSVKEIIFLLSKDFFVLVIISGIIAVPASYYFMHSWLEQFAYRININPVVFVLSIIAVLFIALLTISYHAIKAATANPVKSLRYE
ncbi:MAG: ABC transporter permease [Ignavibacteriaceae bacterium]